MTSAPNTSSNPFDEDSDESLSPIVGEILYACTAILKQKGIITRKAVTNISDQAWLLGDQIASILLQMVEDHELTEVEELYGNDEFTEVMSVDDGQIVGIQDCNQECSQGSGQNSFLTGKN
jgi:hypothetical protein